VLQRTPIRSHSRSTGLQLKIVVCVYATGQQSKEAAGMLSQPRLPQCLLLQDAGCIPRLCTKVRSPCIRDCCNLLAVYEHLVAV